MPERKGSAELKEAGLLKGARAMVNRVYGSAAWYVEWDSAGIDALYKPRRETRFVVAGAPPWHSHSGAGGGNKGKEKRNSITRKGSLVTTNGWWVVRMSQEAGQINAIE